MLRRKRRLSAIDRVILNMSKPEIDFTDPALTYKYILYVHNKSDPSSELRRVVREKIPDVIYVQDVAQISASDHPWMDGVPIVVSKASGEVFKGTDAFSEVQKIIDSTPKRLSMGLS